MNEIIIYFEGKRIIIKGSDQQIKDIFYYIKGKYGCHEHSTFEEALQEFDSPPKGSD